MTLHHVYANRSNAGDWLSAMGIQRLLGVPVVEHRCDEPFVPETLDALRALGPSDAIVIGGGGLFMDYFDGFWSGFREIAGRVPFAIWGAGYVDISWEPTLPDQAVLRDVVSQAAVVRVRDELSRQMLLPVDVGRPVVCPSLTTLSPVPLGHGLLHVDALTTVGTPAYERMCEFGVAFAWTTGRPYRKTNNLLDGSERGLEAVLHRYRLSDIVLTSRLHGCLLAMALGRPIVAVSGDRKVDSFMEAAGLSDWVVSHDDVDAAAALLERVVEQPPMHDFLATATAANVAVADEIRRALLLSAEAEAS